MYPKMNSHSNVCRPWAGYQGKLSGTGKLRRKSVGRATSVSIVAPFIRRSGAGLSNASVSFVPATQLVARRVLDKRPTAFLLSLSLCRFFSLPLTLSHPPWLPACLASWLSRSRPRARARAPVYYTIRASTPYRHSPANDGSRRVYPVNLIHT